MDRIKTIVDSKFRFVLLSALRAEQMMRGARPKDDNDNGTVIRVAMNEILDQRVDWDLGPAPGIEAADDAAPDAAPAAETTAESGEEGVN